MHIDSSHYLHLQIDYSVDFFVHLEPKFTQIEYDVQCGLQ